jgi:polar amino acid transport system substrate-binding protein
VEFMMNFCAAYGYQWDFKSMEFDSIAPGCISGKYDFGMNIVVDEERAENSVLSDPYYVCDIIFVLEGEDTRDMGLFEKLSNSFNKTFIKEDRWKLFAEGLLRTLAITVASVILGTLLGFAAYMACRYGNKVANALTGAVDWFIEGIPTVVFLMILSFIVFGNSHLSGTIISILGFSLIFGCGVYNNLKVGMGAIPIGQTEASRALGYSDTQSFFKILLPQAARHFLPIYKSNVVSLIKETSVVGYIAVMDLTKMGDLVRSRTYDPFFALIAVAIMYFVMEAVLVRIVNRVEFSIDPKRRPKEKILAGIEERE